MHFDSSGISIAYERAGSGLPVVLIHGFGSSRKRNWKATGWYDTLTGAGREVIALDCRGHGESDKPHDPAAYAIGEMARDVVRLLDHLGVERAGLMGYSMGARIVEELLIRHGHRCRAAVLAGIGRGANRTTERAETIARALESDDPRAVDDATAVTFRTFAEQGKNDLRALAACMRADHGPVDASALGGISVPVLVVAGSKDDMVSDPRELAVLIPGARAEIIPGRNHHSTVGDRRYKEAVVTFLDEVG